MVINNNISDNKTAIEKWSHGDIFDYPHYAYDVGCTLVGRYMDGECLNFIIDDWQIDLTTSVYSDTETYIRIGQYVKGEKLNPDYELSITNNNNNTYLYDSSYSDYTVSLKAITYYLPEIIKYCQTHEYDGTYPSNMEWGWTKCE